MKLYICGNGLDIHHGLGTNYISYRDWLIKNGHKSIVKDYEQLNCSSDLWKDVEGSLGKKWKSLVFSELNSFLSDDRMFLFDELDYETENTYRFIFAFTGELFHQWLSSIDTSNAESDMHFEDDALYVNFNYTDTLENLYGISKEVVLHIHGALTEIDDDWCFSYSVYPTGNPEYLEIAEPLMEHDKWNSDIIRDVIQFGGSEISIDDVENRIREYIGEDLKADESITKFLELSSKVIKQPQKNFDKLYSFLENKDISEVVVVGLSIGDSDEPYFQNVFLPRYRHLKWSFYFHNDENKRFYEEYAKSNGLEYFSFIPYP